MIFKNFRISSFPTKILPLFAAVAKIRTQSFFPGLFRFATRHRKDQHTFEVDVLASSFASSTELVEKLIFRVSTSGFAFTISYRRYRQSPRAFHHLEDQGLRPSSVSFTS